MNRNLLSAALILGLCGAAAAQSPAFDAELNDELSHVQERAVAKAAKQAADDAKLKAALSSTLTAMNDGVEQGGAVIAYLNANGVKVEFRDMLERSLSSAKTVSLSSKTPPYPRAIGPRIAWEVAPRMLADMPASSEKEYMRRSITARVWLELNGEPSKLPIIEPLTGDKDEQLSHEMKLWLDNKSEMALYKIGEATKTESVMSLMDQEKDPAKLAALKAANKRFTDFLFVEQQSRP
jgi:hypothetical protein